jgi:hypothetical protein
MNLSLGRQQGLTFISLVFLLGFFAFFVLLGLKIVPVYLDHFKVASVVAELEKTPDLEEKSVSDIRESLSKRLGMNYVYDVTQDDIVITKYGHYLKVVIAYNVVKKIIGNLSVLVEFNDVIEVGEK